MSLQVGLLLTFSSIVLALTALFDTIVRRGRARAQLRRLDAFEPLDARALRERELSVPAMERVIVPAMKGLSNLARRFTPASVVDRLDLELRLGGAGPAWDGERVLAMKLIAMAGLGLFSLLIASAAGLQTIQVIVFAGIFTMLGWYGPEWVLRSRSGERQDAIRRALPDALDLLSISVNAGLGFDAALDRVSREMKGPLGEEFYRAVQEMRLGKDRSAAMRGLGDRTDIPEMDSFVLSMVQAETFGVSISGVLESQAKELRVKRRQRAEEAAQKIPIKILMPLILCIFPTLLIIIVGPAGITIYQNFIQ